MYMTGAAFLAQPPPISRLKQTKAIIFRNMESPSSPKANRASAYLRTCGLVFVRPARSIHSSMSSLSRHLVVSAPIKLPSRDGFMHAAPLYEEKRDPILMTLPSDRGDPFSPHRPSAETALTAYNPPRTSRQLKRTHAPHKALARKKRSPR